MGNKKCGVFDYLEWRGDLTFTQSGFNEIDALILSIFAYLDFSYIDHEEIFFFRNAIQKLNQLPDEEKYRGPTVDIMHLIVKLAVRAAEYPRFQEIGVYNFENITDEKKEIQFAAVTFILPDQTAFISFRGTDNTLIGWKEDLNMCFASGIPSQIEATEYAERIAIRINMALRIGGHSKGGNLAVWAGTHLPIEFQSRIINIYSNDGPGFSEEFLKSSGYLGVREKICSFVPESSIVGVLMEHDEYTTILSSNPTVLQHDPFSWLIIGTHFIYDNTRTISGKQFERIINSWIRSMSVEEREDLINSVYGIVSASHAKTIDDIDKKKIKSILSMQKTFREMGVKRQTQLILSLSKVIFNKDILANSNIFTLLSEDDEAKMDKNHRGNAHLGEI